MHWSVADSAPSDPPDSGDTVQTGGRYSGDRRELESDSPLQKIARAIYVVAAMSLLTVAYSLLIVTGPAAVIALFGVARKIVRGDAVTIGPTFRTLFRENWKQSLLVGWILMAGGWMILVDLDQTPLHSLLRLEIWALLALYISLWINVACLMVHMRMTHWNLVKAAFKLVFYRADLTLANLAVLYLLGILALRVPLSLILLYPGVVALVSYWLFGRKIRALEAVENRVLS